MHVGLLPQDVLDNENDFVKRCFADDDTLATMDRIADNGMQQYRRTRTEASRGGVKAAKAINKQNLIKDIHPLIVGRLRSIGRMTRAVAYCPPPVHRL